MECMRLIPQSLLNSKVISSLSAGGRGLRKRFAAWARDVLIYWVLRFVVVCAILICIWNLLPYFLEDPMIKLQARTPVRTWYDRNGTPVYYERTYEHQWRFPVSLDEISPEVIDVIINTEDRRFWQHNGIDYLSILRAFFQNLFHGNVISGASTISMQIADMEYLNGKRTIGRKIMQLLKARRIEQLHSKEEILEVYLNNLPFGENYYGIETAARQYFGMNSDSITIVEASLLCGLPQRPNAYRPNVNPDAARARQRRVLDGLVKSAL